MDLCRPRGGLCDICRDADFLGMFIGKDVFEGAFNPYREDLDPKKQVPRTWQHIREHQHLCSFCRLTYKQLQHYSAFSETKEEITIAVVRSAYLEDDELDNQCPVYIGFHRGIHRGLRPDHESLLIRGLQLAATCSLPSEEDWARLLPGFISEEQASLVEMLSTCRSVGGRSVNREDIDFDLCSRWLQECNNEHRKCQSSMSNDRTGPKRLIDIVEGRLRMGSELLVVRYAALSYVWGCKPELSLEKKTEEYLKNSGEIVPTNERIPRTIRDALIFCRKTKIPYLWVDSLCIIQDDKMDQMFEIPRMYEIYSQANVTLVALSASSSRDPLPGVSPKTRLWHQNRGNVNGLEIITCYPSLVTEIEQSKWFTRGWTLQEAAFSKRLIFFTHTQAIFLCRSSMFCEDTVWEGSSVRATSGNSNAPTQESKDLMNLMLLDVQPSGSIKKFFSILEQFTKRRLTENSDALNAVEAIIKWISTDKEDGSPCLLGMPEKYFGGALGWMSKEGHMPESRSQQTMFPSWSWAGWKGPITWELLRDTPRDRVTGWESSGIVKTTQLDEELYEKTDKSISPVRQHPRHENPGDFLLVGTAVLRFWTSSALILVSRVESARDLHHKGLPTFDIMKQNGNSWGKYQLQCDPYWRSKQPDQLEFIVIAASRLKPPGPPIYAGTQDTVSGTVHYQAKRDGRLFDDYDTYKQIEEHWLNHMQDRVVVDLMCIQWIGEIADRVQVCHSWLLDDWLEMEPKEKYIKLG